MRSSALSVVAVAALGLFVGGLALARAAEAQTYPPPVGSLSVSAAATTTGSTTNVTATVLDNAGAPVKGATVTFRIASQPGSDARWANGGLETTAITDAAGVATVVLSVGSEPGSVIIETVSGDKTSQVTVAVESALPGTGGAPPLDSGGGGVPLWQVAFMSLGAAALAGGLTAVLRRGKKA